MHSAAPQILLVGRSFSPGSQFLVRLCRNGCSCQMAASLDAARAAVRGQDFDLVLSDMGLPDGSAIPLVTLLERSQATLFFCVGVHDGCWWLPALARGQRTWGQAALRPPDFAHALAELLGADMLRTAADAPNVIPMPPVEISPPKPERAPTEDAQTRKSSA